MSKNNSLIIGLAGIGLAFYLFNENKKSASSTKRAALINMGETQAEKDKKAQIFNRFTDSEINLIYDVQIAKKYGSNVPESIKAQIAAISEKYGVV